MNMRTWGGGGLSSNQLVEDRSTEYGLSVEYREFGSQKHLVNDIALPTCRSTKIILDRKLDGTKHKKVLLEIMEHENNGGVISLVVVWDRSTPYRVRVTGGIGIESSGERCSSDYESRLIRQSTINSIPLHTT